MHYLLIRQLNFLSWGIHEGIIGWEAHANFRGHSAGTTIIYVRTCITSHTHAPRPHTPLPTPPISVASTLQNDMAPHERLKRISQLSGRAVLHACLSKSPMGDQWSTEPLNILCHAIPIQWLQAVTSAGTQALCHGYQYFCVLFVLLVKAKKKEVEIAAKKHEKVEKLQSQKARLSTLKGKYFDPLSNTLDQCQSNTRPRFNHTFERYHKPIHTQVRQSKSNSKSDLK